MKEQPNWCKDMNPRNYYMSIQDNETFLIVVDMIYTQHIHEDGDDEDKLLHILWDIAEFSCYQGAHMERSSKPDKGSIAPHDEMLAMFKAIDNRYTLARMYIKTHYDVEFSPLFIFTLFRTLFNSKSNAPYDVEMKIAYDNFVKIREDEVASALESHEKVNPETVPENCTVETLQEFFTTLNKLGKFLQNRDAYATDKERKLHDQIMTSYYTIIKQGGEQS